MPVSIFDVSQKIKATHNGIQALDNSSCCSLFPDSCGLAWGEAEKYHYRGSEIWAYINCNVFFHDHRRLDSQQSCMVRTCNHGILPPCGKPGVETIYMFLIATALNLIMKGMLLSFETSDLMIKSMSDLGRVSYSDRLEMHRPGQDFMVTVCHSLRFWQLVWRIIT